ncbi:MAG: DnaJ domain-containing protein [Salaquimonas sp.]
MKPTSSLFDSIRVGNKSSKKKEEPAKQLCQWEGCENPGTHKAPMGRNREGQYLWMCIGHVRDYNKNFNYFSGLDDDAIAKFQKEAITGARPTWQVSSNKTSKHPPLNERNPNAEGAQRLYNRTNYGAAARAGRVAPIRARKLKALEKKAFDDLNLPHTAKAEEVKARYKLLVKQNHPDANGGDRSSEERLREIIFAYKILQKAGFS